MRAEQARLPHILYLPLSHILIEGSQLRGHYPRNPIQQVQGKETLGRWSHVSFR